MIHLKTPAYITVFTKMEGKKIKTSLQPVGLYDRMAFRKVNERKICLRKSGSFKIPTNHLNPVYQVAVALQNLKPNKLGVEIEIEKNIPSFSGLNCQMGNAAGTLIALNRLWKFDLSQKKLLEIAKSVDLQIAKILKLHFTPPKKRIQKIVLIRPKHIVIDKGWLMEKSKEAGETKKNPLEELAFRHFPDLKEIIKVFQKEKMSPCGMSGMGSVLFGFQKRETDLKKIGKILIPKADFLWFGKTCNGSFKLLE